jgi:hypothetical protein
MQVSRDNGCRPRRDFWFSVPHRREVFSALEQAGMHACILGENGRLVFISSLVAEVQRHKRVSRVCSGNMH